MSNGKREQGFTLVEVIVAVVIISIVLAGVVYMAISAGHSTQRNVVRQKMATAAQKEIDYRKANPNTWVPTCKTIAPAPCSIQPNNQRYRAESSNDPDFQIWAQIEPIDSDADGLGPQDKDQQTPDFYRMQMTVVLTAADQEKFGKQRPYTTSTTLDSLALQGATGSLTVQVCEVSNQIDERMSFSSCSNGEQKLEMQKQPEPCEENEEMTADDRRKAIDEEDKKFRLRCNEAWNEAKEEKKDEGYAHVKVKPSGQGFNVTPTGGTRANLRTSRMADSVSGDGSSFTYSNMAPGQYKLDVQLGDDKEIWKSHTIPSDLNFNVTANQQARALIVIRPKQGEGKYTVKFSRNVYMYEVKTKTKTVRENTPTAYGAFQATSQYEYIYAERTEVKKYDGPSFSGFIAMEPKPFDRYRQEGQEDDIDSAQYVHEVQWQEEANDDAQAKDNGDNSEDGEFVFGTDYSGDSMPTGLYSVPEQLPTKREGLYGWMDSEDTGRPEKKCEGGGACSTDQEWLVWMDGKTADSTVEFFDEEWGECYYKSSAPGYGSQTLTIMGGGEQPDSGEEGKDRCERDFTVNGRTIKDFFPGRDGSGGKTVLVRAMQTTGCMPPAVCAPASTGWMPSVPSGGSSTGYGGDHSSGGQGGGGTDSGGSGSGENYSTGNTGGGYSDSTPAATDAGSMDGGVSANGGEPDTPTIPNPQPTVVTMTGCPTLFCPPQPTVGVPTATVSSGPMYGQG